jgi:hypothetical protein
VVLTGKALAPAIEPIIESKIENSASCNEALSAYDFPYVAKARVGWLRVTLRATPTASCYSFTAPVIAAT